MLTQNDLLVEPSRPPHRLPPLDLPKQASNLPQYPASVDIPMQEIRRQNDVERWRNKLRLQEKFEVTRPVFCHGDRSKRIIFFSSNAMRIR